MNDTRQILVQYDAHVVAWVAERMPYPCDFKNSVGIGVVRGSEIIAGVVYTPFREGDMDMSVAAAAQSNWLGKDMLRGFFWYPFIRAGCRRVTSIIPAHNKSSRRFCEGLGFTLEGFHEKGFPDDGAISYGLLYESCRWLRHDEQEKQEREKYMRERLRA